MHLPPLLPVRLCVRVRACEYAQARGHAPRLLAISHDHAASTVSSSMYFCLRAYVRACVRVCVCACLCVCARAYNSLERSPPVMGATVHTVTVRDCRWKSRTCTNTCTYRHRNRDTDRQTDIRSLRAIAPCQSAGLGYVNERVFRLRMSEGSQPPAGSRGQAAAAIALPDCHHVQLQGAAAAALARTHARTHAHDTA